MNIRDYPVAIIGSGPIGMAAAAHLVARNIPFFLFESGHSVGTNLLDWGHVRVFSPWRNNIDKVAAMLLQEMNWQQPKPNQLPTGEEIVKHYLLPLSFHPKIEPNIHLSSRVVSITRKGLDKMKTVNRGKVPFLVKVIKNGELSNFEASAIIDASGTWQNPNPIGAGGILASGELQHNNRIAYRIPDILGIDKSRYANKTVAVVGAGHSALNSLLDLAKLQEIYPKTRIHWILRKENITGVYDGTENDALKARGALGVRVEKLVRSEIIEIYNSFYIHEVSSKEGLLTVKGVHKNTIGEISGIDEIIANTGGRPDFSMLREVRIHMDSALESVPKLAELIDPNLHSCGTVRPHGELELRQPEENFYVVGAKSYGRAPTFLMTTGYEQVRSIVAWLDGDLIAARKVELDLSQSVVCTISDASLRACCSPVSAKNKTKFNSNISCSSSINDHLNTNIMKKKKNLKVNQPEPIGCCGGAPSSNGAACCKLDEEKKAEGLSGCGCGSSAKAEENLSSSNTSGDKGSAINSFISLIILYTTGKQSIFLIITLIIISIRYKIRFM